MRINIDTSRKFFDSSGIRIVQGEDSATKHEFVMPATNGQLDLSALTYTMRGTSLDCETEATQAMTSTVSGDSVILSWVPSDDFSASPGKMQLIIVGSNLAGTAIIKFDCEPITVGDDISTSGYASATPSAYEQLVAQVGAGLATVANVAAAEVEREAAEDEREALADKWSNPSVTAVAAAGETPSATVEVGANGVRFGFQLVRGKQGASGHGVEIKGTYATLAALEAAITAPAQGDMYNIGADEPYAIHMWDATTPPGAWVLQGQIPGPPGADGEPGPRGLSGVYVGSGEMPSGYNVHVDPAGEATVVQSVNGVEPDDAGEVTLKPGDIGAGQCNSNLFINPYWGRPVKQRTPTIWNTQNVFTIDSWKLFDWGIGTFTVNAGYCTLSDTGSMGERIVQNIESASDLAGKQVTLSALVNGSGIGCLYYKFNDSEKIIGFVGLSSTNSIQSVTLTVPIGTTSCVFGLQIGGSTTLNVIALKLELSSYQTLAHREGDNWVLNAVPDITQEIVRCQRYYYDVACAVGVVIGIANNANYIAVLNCKFGTQMRITPTITIHAINDRTNVGKLSPWQGGSFYPGTAICNYADSVHLDSIVYQADELLPVGTYVVFGFTASDGVFG